MSNEQQPNPGPLAPVKSSDGPASMDVLRYKEELAEKMGLPSPYGMQLLKDCCNDLVASGLAPSHFGKNPMALYAASMRGREMGLKPMESIMETFWAAPGGKLGMYANKQLDIMHRHGIKSKFLKEDADGCEILFTPQPPHEPYTAKFSIQEAKDAGLVKKDSNWEKWRSDMNKARAISRGWRALAGTFGNGAAANLYSKEELEDCGLVDDSADPAADQRRMDVLRAQEDKYKVTLKAQPAEPVTVDVKPAADPVPVKQAPPVEPQEDPLVYEVHVVATTGGGKPKALRCEHIEPQKSPVTAGLMAQSAASDTGMDHIVLERNTKTGEVNQIGGRYKGAVKVPAPKDDPKPTPAPAAQEQPKPEPAAEPPAASTDGSAKQPPTTLERLNALAAFMGMAPKTAMARFNAFMVGFVGMPAKDLKEAKDPATTALKSKALEALECTIHHDADAFNAGPEASGARHRNWLDGVDTYLTSLWPKPEEAATKALAIKLFQQWDNSPGQFKAWVEMDGIDLAFQPMPDVHATLRGFLRTREMSKVLTMARAHNLSVAAIVQQIEERGLKCSLEEATEARIEQAIEGFRLALRDAAKSVDTPAPKAPEPEAPPAAAKADEPEEPAGEDQDSLFSNADW